MPESREPRTTDLDPDCRPEPKTSRFCIRCQKDIRPDRPARRVWLDDRRWATVVHPEDRHLVPPENLGEWLLGMDCAKKIGMEWSVEVQVGEGDA
jgi:hypothetical protein